MSSSSKLSAQPATENASRYLQQLCKHWAHKFPVDFDAKAGKIAMPSADVMLTAHETYLDVTFHPKSGADIERLKKVLEQHIDRFAFREAPLAYHWVAAEKTVQAMPPSEGAQDVHPSPRKPKFQAPPGAVDAHCHVFGPSDKFPYSPQRKYTPFDAPAEKLFALRDHLGFDKNVLVQASCHGKDNSAMLDCLKKSNGRARGVAIVDPSISDDALNALDDAGVRGVRFNFLKRLVDPTPKSEYLKIAHRVSAMGWHVVVYFEAEELEDISPFLKDIPTLVVIDHMGRPDISLGAEHEQFQRFVSLMAENPNFWVKVSCPERLTQAGPPYDDVVPFAKTLVERFPTRVLWGTDWPHPNMKSHIPDDGELVDQIPKIAPTPYLQKRLLVDNPMQLYWPDQTL